MMLSSEKTFPSLEKTMPPLHSVEDFAHILHKCRTERNLGLALRLDAYMCESGLKAHTSLGNYLVSTLVDVGSMRHAQQVFDRLLYREELSFNSLIKGYVKHGEPQLAFTTYQKMQEDDSLQPCGRTFVALLKACTELKDLDLACEIHAMISRKGLLETNVFVGSTLVDMYAKCGSLVKAQEVFDKLPVRNVVSWTALIAGCAEHGHDEEALRCFEQMQHEGVSLDAGTFVCVLKGCGSIGATNKGCQIHAEVVKRGLERDLFVGNTLIDMYAKCNLLAEAQEVFDKLPARSVVSWNALIAGYAEHGPSEEALNCFEQMQDKGIFPSAVTLLHLLKVCGGVGFIDKGREIHAEVARKGLLERDVFIGSTLVDMYAKCGLLGEAQEVFDKIPIRDVVLWNTMIVGYAEHSCREEALCCFEQMQLEDVSPDVVTLVCILKVCGSTGVKDKGCKIHAEIANKGLERDLYVGSTLVDMYARLGSLAEAQEVFDKLLNRNVVLWNALIAGYVELGYGEKALHCFERMQREGIFPDAVTLVCSLKACGSIGVTVKGQRIHAEIARQGLEIELQTGSTLVDMYTKCSSLAEAQEVFDKLPVRNVVSWTALIAGYAKIGESKNVFHMFDRMRAEGIDPDLVTFHSVLNACSHAGLVDKGQTYFNAISKDYGLIPTLEHYTCMVDVLGRAGHIAKAVVMIKKMPFHPGSEVWLTVLGACQKWGNVEFGRHAFEHAMGLNVKDSAAYVCISNIYANAAKKDKNSG